MQAFASKLTDVAVQALCFDAYTIPETSTLQAQAYDKFKDNLIHLISLLHAVGLATLRDDYNVENIVVRTLVCSGQDISCLIHSLSYSYTRLGLLCVR